MPDLTPMMKQYQEIKKKSAGAILLFRMGDFYEMFYEDAKIASSVLEITLTARDGGQTGKYPMCGFPHHASGAYIPRLVKAGYKVAICEQTEDPKKAKGIVKREIIKIITPGTAVDENIISEKQSNYLMAVNRIKNLYGIAVVEISTGEFRLTEIDNEHDFFSEIYRIHPSEFIITESLNNDSEFLDRLKNTDHASLNKYEDWIFEINSAYESVREFLGTYSLAGFGIPDKSPSIGAAGAAIHFLKENLCNALDQIKSLSFYSINDYVIIDPISQRNLELTETIRNDPSGRTLFSVLDFTSTPMGSRLLKQWILFPLIIKGNIIYRQNGVTELIEKNINLDKIEPVLKKIRDVERLISRCGFNQVSPRDIVSLKDSLKQVPDLKEILENFSSQIFVDIKDNIIEQTEIVDLIENAIVDQPPAIIKDGGVFRKGYSKELDEIRDISVNGKSWMAELQNKEIKRTGIKSLKVRYNKVFGYYIEITNSNLEMVPPDYIRKQTLASAERFITSELKEMESKVLNAEEQIKEIEATLFNELREKIIDKTSQILEIGRRCAVLDCLVSLAKTAIYYGYCRPRITDDDILEIINGRHPVVESILNKGEFVPNDIILDTESNQLLIITGPNMAGKSTYIRQAALLVIMAQIGSYIPADSAQIGIVDRIFTRIGASDELSKGLSTFMVEMIETANILNNATNRSLIILDEIGRGTSTFDGISIAWSVAEYLSSTPEVRARTLFATHYHELTELENQIEGIVNYNIAVKEWNDQIIFLRKIVQGGTDKSYGIHVARLAGLPKKVITRAMEILSALENDCIREQTVFTQNEAINPKEEAESEQLMLFGYQKPNPTIERLKKIACDKITPLEALNILYELKEMASENG